MSDSFPDILKNFLVPDERTDLQRRCSHILSSKMHDGMYFCPSCRLVSAEPLQRMDA